MDSRTVDRQGSALDTLVTVLGAVGAVVLLYLAISAVVEATTAIDVPFVNWPF
jgi:threonine/homoserine/homoserine lactone efflux protein